MKTLHSGNGGNLLIRGLAMRTGVPILPAAGPRRYNALHSDGIEALRTSYKEYGTATRIIGISILGDLRQLPQHHQYLQLAPAPLIPKFDDRHKWEAASAAVRKKISGSDASRSERLARSSLELSIAAYNLLEDVPQADELLEAAHVQAHRCGELVGGIFGCYADLEDGKFWDVCKLHLMHHRFGLSVGITTNLLCSICRNPIDECDHCLDEEYPVVVSRTLDGTCSACGQRSCDHIPGASLKIRPVAMHGDIELDEISFVSRPRDPLARVQGIHHHGLDIGSSEPSNHFLACDRCIGPCQGFSSPFD